MGVLKNFFSRFHKPPCDPCLMKISEIKQSNADLQDRISRLESTMDGEDGWFLTLNKREDTDKHG
jgi:hypothetical protein